MSNDPKSKKKELKTVDLKDLRSSDPFEEYDYQDEIIVETGVGVDELDSHGHKSVSRPTSKNSKSGPLTEDPKKSKILQERAQSLDRLKILDEKRSFDRKTINWSGVGIIGLIVLLGVFFQNVPSDLDTTGVKDNLRVFARIISYAFNMFSFLGDYWPIIALGSLAFVPLKKNSKDYFALSFDGITVPSEVGTNGPRKRVSWSSIKKVEFGRSSFIPVMRLLSESGRVMGEVRLDIDDPKGLHKAIDRFAPKGSPVRKLINN